MFRDAVRTALGAAGGFEVVADACDGDEAVRCVLKHRPRVLLLDLALPRAGGLDALRQLRDHETGVLPVVLADTVTNADAVTALTLGARGVLTKDVLLSVLFDCLTAVAQGNYWIANEQIRAVVDAAQGMRTQAPPTPAETLTSREMEIVAAVADGATNLDISVGLKISVQTVKNHLSRVFDKLGVSSRLELAMYAADRDVGLQRPFTGLRH
jgi:two-component system, NarL family, nitrate/nitrite response regulator NarL